MEFKLLKYLIKKLFGAIVDRPLSRPSSEEKVLLHELHNEFWRLPVFNTANTQPSEAAWLTNMNRLRAAVLSQDPREFLRWDVISKTMVVSPFAGYVCTELRYLRSLTDWSTRWRSAINESEVGHPIPCIFNRASSSNLIHHAYHLAQFEANTKVKIHDLKYVLEIGGGYGSMCRLFHNLGFQGKYIIYDLPSFSALQRYFLGAHRLPVQSNSKFLSSSSGIVCVSELEHLKLLIADKFPLQNTIFLATWSISETPLRIRESLLPLASQFHSFLLAFQDRFEEVDNLNFFDYWQRTISNVIWQTCRINHMPGDSYLIGRVTTKL